MLKRTFSAQVFNQVVKTIQRNRAYRHEDHDQFAYLRHEVASRLVDRLQDIQRVFPLALDVGCGAGYINEQLKTDPGLGGIEKLIQMDASDESIRKMSMVEDTAEISTVAVVADEEFLPFPNEHFDLVLSSLNLHWVNDLPRAFGQIRSVLKPDGVFLGAMIGGETLKELRSAFVLADEERRGGVYPHVSPMVAMSDIGRLMQGAGFALPTVDTDYIQVNYENAFELMEHLQGMGESNAPFMPLPSTSKDSLIAMASIYQKLYGNPDGTIPATFQVIYVIGWAPEASQPQSLPRGSATISMKTLQSDNVP